MSSVNPGISSSVTLATVSFNATVSIEGTEEVEKIDVTGFGDVSRVFALGVKAAVEVTVRTYADPGNYSVGDSIASSSIKFGGATGRELSGACKVITYNSSADVDGATVYEIGLLY